MPSLNIVRRIDIVRAPRVVQIESIFDVPEASFSEQKWHIDFNLPDKWNVGAIVGPSGSGKSTIAREMWQGKGDFFQDHHWPESQSLIDAFPEGMSIKDIGYFLSSVGFSSVPSWLKPYHVLSNGEKFRVTLARVLAESKTVAIVDEFTSVVDRRVAQVAAYAVGKATKKMDKQFVAVSCHYDILEWLEPDWIIEAHKCDFKITKEVLRRPPINLEVRRIHHSAWDLFSPYHYMSGELNKSAKCFVAFWQDEPVAFQAVLPTPHPKVKKLYRGHRAVCLPDYQGLGIGNLLINTVASAYRGIGARITSATASPALVRHRLKSHDWLCLRKPSLNQPQTSRSTLSGDLKHATNRLTSTWEFVGQGMDRNDAEKFIYN